MAGYDERLDGGYAARSADPRIAAQIRGALGDTRRVVVCAAAHGPSAVETSLARDERDLGYRLLVSE